jgi:hypothetical protein
MNKTTACPAIKTGINCPEKDAAVAATANAATAITRNHNKKTSRRD